MKAERLRRGLSQTKLAARSRLSASDISRIENGRFRPYPKQAMRLARALGLPVDELLRPAEE
jgi:transcriptional regulator with XRE-family HTH domain